MAGSPFVYPRSVDARRACFVTAVPQLEWNLCRCLEHPESEKLSAFREESPNAMADAVFGLAVNHKIFDFPLKLPLPVPR
jgi:hypothetical protein